MSSDELAGLHVLLTGATGFLGQATLERLLSSYP
jgi:alcohol-forming fatty acyl-CoA reductase